jgi:hypothetical protein
VEIDLVIGCEFERFALRTVLAVFLEKLRPGAVLEVIGTELWE